MNAEPVQTRTEPEGHFCSVYQDDEGRLMALLRFVGSGLDRGEACVCVTEDALVGPLREGLIRAGVEVVYEEDTGSLAILSPADYGLVGKFQAEAMLASLAEAHQQAVRLGFAALRVAEDMTWTLELGIACDELRTYEALLNDLPSRGDRRHLCLYDRRRFAPAAILTVLRTHLVVVLGQQAFANPNIALSRPDLDFDQEVTLERVRSMLQQVRRYPIVP